jgi:Fic family protein
MAMITDCSYLDPVLPENLPASIINSADMLQRKIEFLAGCMAPETSARVTGLLRLTNSYYSNLIEGHYSTTVDLQHAQNAPWRDRKQLTDLAVQHVEAQAVLERAIRRCQSNDFAVMFDPKLLEQIHYRLFRHVPPESLLLGDGWQMEPGRLRSKEREQVIVGKHQAPAPAVVRSMLQHLQIHFGCIEDPRLRLIAVLANHHRTAFVHPFLDGNGRVTRMLTHLQLCHLNLRPELWSLSRGLARRHQDYYLYLSLADSPRQGGMDGHGQLSQRHYFGFIEFMLEVCHDQVNYMTEALNTVTLRERLTRVFQYNTQLRCRGVRPATASAVLALITLGSMPRSEFKAFTGLNPRQASDELTALVNLGVVLSKSPKARIIEPGLPTWFADEIFPNLHRQIQ